MRAAKKALAFSVVHFLVGITVAYALTGQAAVALGVALVEPAINAVILFFHARWEEGHLTWPGKGHGPHTHAHV
jgi:uncharacterized membrane protein